MLWLRSLDQHLQLLVVVVMVSNSVLLVIIMMVCFANLGLRFKNQEDWLQNLSKNFLKIVSEGKKLKFGTVHLNINVVAGLEAARRESILRKIKEKKKLSPQQNCAVIHSINYAIKEQFGRRRPDSELCR